MLSNSTYHSEFQEYVKETILLQKQTSQEFSVSYKNDQDYQQFLASVQLIHLNTFGEVISDTDRGLYALWYRGKYFRSHWMKPTQRSEESMCYSAARFGLTRQRIISVILAWWQKHQRNMSQEQYDVWQERVLTKKLKEAEQYRNEHESKKMEKNANKLSYKVIEQLKQGRSTPNQLARDLGVTVESIESQLRRLKRATKRRPALVRSMVYLGQRGFYELVK